MAQKRLQGFVICILWCQKVTIYASSALSYTFPSTISGEDARPSMFFKLKQNLASSYTQKGM